MFPKLLAHVRRQYAGFLALFIVLGGTSYAVATGSIDSREIKNNTIRSKDIRNNDVRGKDIRNNDVRGKDIRAGTIGSSDVKNDSLTGADILESSLARVPSAFSAITAGTAARATTATTAGAAEPRAFARVADEGTIIASLSKNIGSTNVTHTPGSGLYCFDLPFRPRTALATTSARGAEQDNIVSVSLRSTEEAFLSDCGAGAEVEVRTTDNSGAEEDGEFYIQIN